MYMYVYVYIYTYTYIYIYIYIHTCKVHNCSQAFPNVYIHRAVGGLRQDMCQRTATHAMRDLLSAPWMVKYAQNPGGANAPPCSPLRTPMQILGEGKNFGKICFQTTF